MNLVIVSGPEATGKSGIAQEVAQLLGYKYQSKDVIKEQMFDQGSHDTTTRLGTKTRPKTNSLSKLNNL